MKKLKFLFLLLLAGCIGEDIVFDEVDPLIRITNPVTSMQVNTSYQFEYVFLDNVGMEVTPTSISWTSLDTDILTVDDSGLVMGVSTGLVSVEVEAEFEDLMASTTLVFEVTEEVTMMMTMERTGSIQTTSTYPLSGNFTLSENGTGLLLSFGSDYVADSRLPGLYVYLSNNPNSPAGALEIGEVRDFSGAHEYNISNADLFDYDYVLYYCKPFNVKVGHGEIE